MQLEEKYQKILKECQKRPENRTCNDCTGRGNQYVVLNYGVFVCTTCSGIHREEQHKIKSADKQAAMKAEIDAAHYKGAASQGAAMGSRLGATKAPGAGGAPPSA